MILVSKAGKKKTEIVPGVAVVTAGIKSLL
jgi:hypothetical protein